MSEVCPGAGSGSEEGGALSLSGARCCHLQKAPLAKQSLMNYPALKIDRPYVAFLTCIDPCFHLAQSTRAQPGAVGGEGLGDKLGGFLCSGHSRSGLRKALLAAKGSQHPI